MPSNNSCNQGFLLRANLVPYLSSEMWAIGGVRNAIDGRFCAVGWRWAERRWDGLSALEVCVGLITQGDALGWYDARLWR